MPVSLPARGALAAVTAALSLGLAGPALAGDPVTPTTSLHSAYDFNFADALAPSFFTAQESSFPLEVSGTTTTPTETVGGSARKVLQFPDGTSLGANTAGLASDFTLTMYFRLTDVDANDGVAGDRQRLVTYGSTGLHLIDDTLAWIEGDTESVATEELTDNTWTELTLVRSGGGVEIYLGEDDTPAIDVASTVVPDLGFVELFGALGGQLARLRLFNGVVLADQTQTLDTTAPTDPVDGLEGWGRYDDGTVTWLGPKSELYGNLSDDGTAPPQVSWALREANGGDEVGAGPVPWAGENFMPASGVELLHSTFHIPLLSEFALENGVDYELDLSATDGAGNTAGPSTFAFRADTVAPTGLSLTTPERTSDRTPTISGTAVRGARDEGSVYGDICRPDCDFASEADYEAKYVGSFEAEIAGGRWSTDQIFTYDFILRGFGRTPVGDLPKGTYRVEVSHWDLVSNSVHAARSLTIADPVVDTGKTTTTTTPPTPPAPPANLPPAPERLTPRQLVQRLMTSAVQQLRRETIRSLVKDGVSVPAGATSPGTVIVQLYDGSAPKAIAAARRRKPKAPIGSGRRVFRTAGTGPVKVALTKKGKAALKRRKKAKVVVRTIFVPRGGKPVASDRTLTLKR